MEPLHSIWYFTNFRTDTIVRIEYQAVAPTRIHRPAMNSFRTSGEIMVENTLQGNIGLNP